MKRQGPPVNEAGPAYRTDYTHRHAVRGDQAFNVASTSLKVLLGRIASLTLARSGW